MGGCKRLNELQLAANQISDGGLIALADALHSVPSLTNLALGSAVGGNLIGDGGVRHLCAALRQLDGGRKLSVVLKGNHLISPAAMEEARQAERELCQPDLLGGGGGGSAVRVLL